MGFGDDVLEEDPRSRAKEIVRIMISDSGHEMDALGHAGDERRRRPRKSTVSCQTSFDPYVSEWGNPAGVMSCNHMVSKVAM